MGLLVWILLVAVALLLTAGGGVLALRARKPAEEAVCNFECPHCGRKLRYRGQKAGKAGMCPLCRKPLVYPHPPERPQRGPGA